jgi:hypothetical protein
VIVRYFPGRVVTGADDGARAAEGARARGSLGCALYRVAGGAPWRGTHAEDGLASSSAVQARRAVAGPRWASAGWRAETEIGRARECGLGPKG